MPATRALLAEEIAMAWTVYRDTIPYDRVVIADLSIGGGAPVTVAGAELRWPARFRYRICWARGFRGTVDDARARSTLIHELCHVWQGEHGVWPTLYMAQSAADQLVGGARDVLRTRRWRGWDRHRAAAYRLDASDWGRDWTTFGVEQQASIVESWFLREADRRRLSEDFGPGVIGGDASPLDPRFPYISDVIRAGDRSASYRPVQPESSSQDDARKSA